VVRCTLKVPVRIGLLVVLLGDNDSNVVDVFTGLEYVVLIGLLVVFVGESEIKLLFLSLSGLRMADPTSPKNGVVISGLGRVFKRLCL